MLSLHLSRRLEVLSLLLFSFLAVSGFFVSPPCHGACEMLSEDFTSGADWTVSSHADWTLSSEMLDVQNIAVDSLPHAGVDFSPADFFSVDVDVHILSSSDQYDAVGIYFFTSYDVLFSVVGDSQDYTTDGVAVLYYPVTGHVRFLVWDITAGEWVFLAAHPVSGAVSSIGLSMVADGVIIRVNGQDTNFKLAGNFSLGSDIIDTLWLVAKGTGLHARFDNVCASAYEISDFPSGNAMPLPSGAEILQVSPAAAPVTSIDPAQANPFGFGAAASGGATLSLSAGISGLAGPADLYIGLQSDVFGPEFWLFTGYNSLQPFSSAGLVKWQSNTTGGLSAALLGDFPVLLLPAGTYNFYFIMTSAGRLDVYRIWVSSLVIGGGSSIITDQEMEQEIRQNIDLIFGITSGFSGGLTELTTIFSDKNVVTTDPAEISLTSLMSGTPITITADFGSGYTMTSGSVMSGSAQIVISNVVFGDQGIGADFSGTFNNVMKDGAPFVNGQISGNLLLTPSSGDKNNVSGQININNLSISGQQLSGTIQISGTLDELNLSKLLETTGTIRLTFSNFILGAYTINSGFVDIVIPQGGSPNVITNLQTSQGPINLNVLLTTMPNDAWVINTSAPGTAGPYTVAISNVTLDQNICANYPASGTISFTKSSTGTTGVVTFTGACDGSYGYSEQ
ncbi:MAG: hypothetical protein J7K15_04990 [Deltaproteobacteria bacterium]|nr:hypothetical protein [Deltaproteobacteria bacterium]